MFAPGPIAASNLHMNQRQLSVTEFAPLKVTFVGG
jgi:hypothetical protein